jgi:AraC family transcriptional regulator of adaptative response / DNA-3-methyladenine glycosylase II
MDLDPKRCYEALRSRDARFDGRFFTAVLTTGIYCRPVCPARPPGRANVRFFPCAAAAEEAGFRPCRRCRPEASPGTPAWLGTSATVLRGLRLISEGVVEKGGIEELALRLGVGERQVRRLFMRHLGAPPLSVARTRRTHFARRLIDQTRLPMSQVAFASGFSSIRQFNDAVKSVFGRTPTELRAERSAASRDQSGLLCLRLSHRNPLDWTSLWTFLTRRAIPGVEAVEPGCYRRSIASEGNAGLIEVRPVAGRSEVTLSVKAPIGKELISLVERTRRLFDLDADPMAVAECLQADPVLSPLVRARPGLRVPGAWDGFELAVRAILGQQITVSAAGTLAGRLAETFGPPVPFREFGLTRLFPDAETLARADLARVGLPRARARALRALAAAVAEGELDLTPSADPEKTVSRLREISGIGEWTAQYIAMRALRDPDACPAGDLGLRRALADRDGGSDRPPAVADVKARAERWRPWRAYAVMHLWAAS